MRDFEDVRSAELTDFAPMDIVELARQLHIMQLSLDGTLMTDGQLADMTALGAARGRGGAR